MQIDQIKAWFNSQVPESSRRTVMLYILHLITVQELKDQALKDGVTENTLKMIEMALPMISQQFTNFVK